MGDVKSHLIQGAASSVALYPLLGTDSLIVGVSVVLIDADHIMEYAYATGHVNLSGIYKLRDLAHKHMHEIIGLNLFHTIDCYVLLYILGLYISQKFFYVLAGFIIHHIFDEIYLIRLGHPFVRAFFLLEYAIRSRNLMTMKQLTKKYNL